MEKFIKIGTDAGSSWDSFYHVLRGGRSDLVKFAAAGNYHPRIERFLATEPFTRRDLVLVVVPLGVYEAWGPNVNGDAFQQDQIEPSHRDWGHESFVHHANGFLHHQNKDPDKGFGKIPISVFEPVMRRIEAIFRLDRDKAERVGAGDVIKKLDGGGSVDLSMGCKVPYDVCSICGQESKSISNYCTHLRHEMLKIDPDGKIHCAFNPKPRFFDLSCVVVRAAKEAAILEKAASAGIVLSENSADVVPIEEASSFHMDDDSGLYLMKSANAKTADTKLAEIEKRLPDVFNELVWPMYRSEEPISDSILDRLAEHPLGKSLASTAACGIVLRPREFQRLYLQRTGRPEMADELHNSRCIFEPRDSSGSYRLQANDIVEKILPLLENLLPGRSAFQPFVSKRIIVVRIRGEKPQEPELVEKTSSVLDEVGEEYAKYINGLARLPSLLKSAMVRHGDLYDTFAAESYDPMRKVAGSLASAIGPGVGVVLPTYLLAAKWRSKAAQGVDTGLLENFVADYPGTTAVGLLTGMNYLGKRFR